MEKSATLSPAWLDRLQDLDQRAFFRLFRPDARPAFHHLLRALTRSADGWLYPLLLLPAFAFPGTAYHRVLIAALFAYGIERITYRTLKSTLRRPRPCHRLDGVRHLLPPPDEFSFPSGHTAAAVVFALLLTSLLPAWTPLLFAWAVGVGLSRIGLGVHYPADVLAGAALGFAAATAGLRLALAVSPP